MSAVDDDAGDNGRVRYELTERTKTEQGELFGIEEATGRLFLRGRLDYETSRVHLLSVAAIDGGPESLPAHVPVVVRVMDVNDNPPTITVNFLSASGRPEVTENTDAGAFVAHVSVGDPDAGDGGRFDCHLPDDLLFRLEQMYPTQFKIVTAVSFDREKKDSAETTIICEDRGAPSLNASLRLRVDILDENDNDPRFGEDLYTASIRENNELGEFILAVEAIDYDDGHNGIVVYELDSSSPLVAARMFHIDAETGSIMADVVFDRERVRELDFRVVARDQGVIERRSTGARVRVTIVDVDDERPTFDSETYTFGVSENQSVGTEVGSVVARDPDSSPFDRFSYFLDPTSTEAAAVFDVDPLTGRITTRVVLDREVLH